MTPWTVNLAEIKRNPGILLIYFMVLISIIIVFALALRGYGNSRYNQGYNDGLKACQQVEQQPISSESKILYKLKAGRPVPFIEVTSTGAVRLIR